MTTTKQKWLVSVVALVLIGVTGGYLMQVRAHQRLGSPGVKAVPLEGSDNLQVVLPAELPGYVSEELPMQQIVLDWLPKDTSFGQRVYTAEDGFQTLVNVVLMGKDRTSIHRPQICLKGGGWQIDKSEVVSIPMERPVNYDLPVMKLAVSPAQAGSFGDQRGVYVYWFVADDRYTPYHEQRMWWMAAHMFHKYELQRWAYVTYFSVCAPGEEDATFERMKRIIAASVPEFQLVPRPQDQPSVLSAVSE